MKLMRVGKLNNTAQLSREPPDKPVVLSERAKIELALMEKFWNATMSDAEWLRLCDEKAGRIGKDGLT